MKNEKEKKLKQEYWIGLSKNNRNKTETHPYQTS